MKKITGIFLKIFISSALLIYLFLFSDIVDFQEVLEILGKTRPSLFILVVLIYFGNVLITTKRWSLFLPGDLRYSRLFSLSLIGYFFNTFLPGRLGGDIVKTLYLYRDIGKGTISIASVLLDRYMGLFAMIMIGFTAFLWGYPHFQDTGIDLLIPAVFFIFLGGSIILWKVNWGRIKGLQSVYLSFMACRGGVSTALKGLLLSVVVQLFSILGIYVISLSIDINVPVIYYFIFVPIINAVSTVPFTVAGLGVREAGFAALFSIFFTRLGVTSGQAVGISLLSFAAMVIVNMFGGIEYLRIRRQPEDEGRR